MRKKTNQCSKDNPVKSNLSDVLLWLPCCNLHIILILGKKRLSFNHYLMTLIYDDQRAWTHGRTKADDERLNCGTLADNVAKHNSRSGSHKISVFSIKQRGKSVTYEGFSQ